MHKTVHGLRRHSLGFLASWFVWRHGVDLKSAVTANPVLPGMSWKRKGRCPARDFAAPLMGCARPGGRVSVSGPDGSIHP